jgi:hypothetical protein
VHFLWCRNSLFLFPLPPPPFPMLWAIHLLHESKDAIDPFVFPTPSTFLEIYIPWQLKVYDIMDSPAAMVGSLQFQHRNPPALSIQDSPIHSERTLVHKQSQNPWRSTNKHSAQ